MKGLDNGDVLTYLTATQPGVVGMPDPSVVKVIVNKPFTVGNEDTGLNPVRWFKFSIRYPATLYVQPDNSVSVSPILYIASDTTVNQVLTVGGYIKQSYLDL